MSSDERAALSGIHLDGGVEPLEPTQKGRPPSQRQRAGDALLGFAAEASGGVWDKPLPWAPLRAALLEAGFSKDTIRRAAKDLGVRFRPTKGKAMKAYPPKPQESQKRVPAIDHSALADLADDPSPQYILRDPERTAKPIGLSGISYAAAARLASDHGVRTVADGLAVDDLDAAIGTFNADRLRAFARGE